MSEGDEYVVWAAPTDLRGLVDALPKGLVVVNRSGQVVFANPACEEALGQSLAEVMGSTQDVSASEVVVAESRVPVEWLKLYWDGNLTRAGMLDVSQAVSLAAMEELQTWYEEQAQELEDCRRSLTALQSEASGSTELKEAHQAELARCQARVEELQQRVCEAEAGAERQSRLPALRSPVEDREYTDAERLAFQDLLTGLGNFNLVHEFLAKMAGRIETGKTTAALLLVDLDRFRVLNDSLGQQNGDRLLQLAGKRLSKLVKAPHAMGRGREDQFLIVCSHTQIGRHDQENAAGIAQGLARQVLGAFSDAFELDDRAIYVTASVGVSTYPGDATSVDELLEHAEIALHRAKELGRSRIQAYTEGMRKRRTQRRSMERQLRESIIREEFVLHYQPIVDLSKGRTVGLEALVRWVKDDQLVGPTSFIPMAEETGMIIPLGDWIVEQALQVAIQHKKLFISMNLSPQQLLQAGFTRRFMSHIQTAGIRPDQVVVELAEGREQSAPERILPALEELKQWGVGIGIDDFGTGSTSLQALRTLQARFLKIDLDLVSGLPNDTVSLGMCQSITGLASGIDLAVVAEGVESLKQLKMLKDFGCSLAQGFYFSPAVPADELKPLLKKKFKFR